jgi:hypothetical protein
MFSLLITLGAVALSVPVLNQLGQYVSPYPTREEDRLNVARLAALDQVAEAEPLAAAPAIETPTDPYLARLAALGIDPADVVAEVGGGLVLRRDFVYDPCDDPRR